MAGGQGAVWVRGVGTTPRALHLCLLRLHPQMHTRGPGRRPPFRSVSVAVLPGGASTSRPPEAGRGRPSSSQLSSLWLHRVGCGGYEDVPKREGFSGGPHSSPRGIAWPAWRRRSWGTTVTGPGVPTVRSERPGVGPPSLTPPGTCRKEPGAGIPGVPWALSGHGCELRPGAPDKGVLASVCSPVDGGQGPCSAQLGQWVRV